MMQGPLPSIYTGGNDSVSSLGSQDLQAVELRPKTLSQLPPNPRAFQLFLLLRSCALPLPTHLNFYSRDRELPSTGLLPKNLQYLVLGLAKAGSQELNPCLPCGCQDSNYLRDRLLPPRVCSCRKLKSRAGYDH